MKLSKADLLARFDNDIELIREVAELFKSSTSEQIHKMRQFLSENDAKMLARCAHSVKGGASNFSATLVTQTAAQLEALGNSSDLTEAAQLLDKLEQEAEELMAFVEQTFSC